DLESVDSLFLPFCVSRNVGVKAMQNAACIEMRGQASTSRLRLSIVAEGEAEKHWAATSETQLPPNV
ncbi:MAG: hypothetical protein SF097_06675, partial [Acidobacteriota bacterium]|nr:hypothetical protein [Acidobacteriota bacterium]